MIQLKRVYDPVNPDHGVSVLVERLWPHGGKVDVAFLERKAAVRDLSAHNIGSSAPLCHSKVRRALRQPSPILSRGNAAAFSWLP